MRSDRTFTTRDGLRLLIAPIALALASSALAVDLPPGGAVALGGASVAGTVIHDQNIPFQIYSGPVLMYAGTVQDRVIRRADNKLIFSKRIRDTQGGLNGWVTDAHVTNFADVSCDVDYSPTGLGTQTPDWATRTGDGSLVSFEFNVNPVYSGMESRFFYVQTDVEDFSMTGTMTIQIASGESATITVASPFYDDTPPVAEIQQPDGLSCVCNPVAITGIAYDPDGTYESDTAEYMPATGGPWTLIGEAFSPVPPPGGLLYYWNTTGLPEGYYLIRLTVYNTSGLSAADVVVVWVDQQFDSFSFSSPATGAVIGGDACPYGMIWDHCVEHFRVEYAPLGGGFAPIDPSTPVYDGDRLNLTFAVWDTTAVPDGSYQLRVTVFDECGHEEEQTHDVIVDNTAPITEITSPTACAGVDGIVAVIGTVDDANLRNWTLQIVGGPYSDWVTIETGTGPIVNGLLGLWDTSGLPSCAYVIRIIAQDDAALNCNSALEHWSEYMTSVIVGGDCLGDLNGDGFVDVLDLLALIAAWGPCEP